MGSKFRLRQLFWPLIIILAGYIAFLYFQPVPSVAPVKDIVTLPQSQPATMPWPATGQAALGATGYGVLSSHNDNQPVPIASIAKIITSLAILQKKPFAPGNAGPLVTFDDSDVAIYNDYYTKGGSVAEIKAGEQLSELQALQAMLLPSANNVADSMARWAFGSVESYVTYANSMVQAMGLKNTHVGGASGFDDKTTSTATDLVKLGIAAMKEPAIAATVSQRTTDLPVAGTVNNVNWLLGQDGVVGIKTGNTDKAGGCYLFATIQKVSGQQITLIGAILAQPQLQDAISAAPPLIHAAGGGFTEDTVLHKGQELAIYKTPWGATSRATATEDVHLLVWNGRPVQVLNEAGSIKTPASKGSLVGFVTAANGQKTSDSRLQLTNDLAGPSWHWRLFRH